MLTIDDVSPDWTEAEAKLLPAALEAKKLGGSARRGFHGFQGARKCLPPVSIGLCLFQIVGSSGDCSRFDGA